jgi:hypothetical protein
MVNGGLSFLWKTLNPSQVIKIVNLSLYCVYRYAVLQRMQYKEMEVSPKFSNIKKYN